mgnify:CR=1 FL=1
MKRFLIHKHISSKALGGYQGFTIRTTYINKRTVRFHESAGQRHCSVRVHASAWPLAPRWAAILLMSLRHASGPALLVLLLASRCCCRLVAVTISLLSPSGSVVASLPPPLSPGGAIIDAHSNPHTIPSSSGKGLPAYLYMLGA